MTIELEIRIAVLLNSNAPFEDEVRHHFATSIHHAAPSAVVSFFNAPERHFPNLADGYHLVIIGGGIPDPGTKTDWHTDLMAFIKIMVENFPKTRLLGIGWGHEFICTTFGGQVETMAKPETGITSLELTLEGKVFLNRAHEDNFELQRSISFEPFLLYTFHKSRVTSIPNNFQPLANNHEMLECCESPVDGGVCQILTIQGHPEYDDYLIKRLFMETEDYVETKDIKEKFEASLNKEREPRTDLLWNAIMAWVMTTRRRSSTGIRNRGLIAKLRGSTSSPAPSL